jgi:signal recognition particle GTPase
MPRSCSGASTERLFNAEKSVSDSEEILAKIMYVVGLNPSDMNNLTVDEIIEALRSTFCLEESSVGRNPAHPLISKNYMTILHQLRKVWLDLQIAKYGATS